MCAHDGSFHKQVGGAQLYRRRGAALSSERGGGTALKAGEMAPTLTQLLTDVGMVTSGKQVKVCEQMKFSFDL